MANSPAFCLCFLLCWRLTPWVGVAHTPCVHFFGSSQLSQVNPYRAHSQICSSPAFPEKKDRKHKKARFVSGQVKHKMNGLVTIGTTSMAAPSSIDQMGLQPLHWRKP